MINSDIIDPVKYSYMSESAAHSSLKLMIASFNHAAATQERVCTHACVSVCTDGACNIHDIVCVNLCCGSATVCTSMEVGRAESIPAAVAII